MTLAIFGLSAEGVGRGPFVLSITFLHTNHIKPKKFLTYIFTGTNSFLLLVELLTYTKDKC